MKDSKMILIARLPIVSNTKIQSTSLLSSENALLVIIVTPHDVKTPIRVINLKIKPQIPMFSTDSGIGL